MNRFVSALVGLGLVGLVPVATASAADAASRSVGTHHVSSAATGSAARAQLPARTITSTMDKLGPRKIIFSGKVKGEPTFANRTLKIERKVGRHGTWLTYARTRTNDRGVWHQRVGAPRKGKWFFRATTAATKRFRESHSDVYYTYTI